MSGSAPVGPPFWMNFLAGPLGGGLDLGLLILRVGFGLMMAVGHGWAKLQNYSSILEKGFLDFAGLGMANSLNAAIFAELVCALLVAVGLLTRLAAIPLVITMGVAAFMVHGSDPLFMTGSGGSKEPALLFFIPFLAILFTGPGRFSIDGLMMQPRKEG